MKNILFNKWKTKQKRVHNISNEFAIQSDKMHKPKLLVPDECKLELEKHHLNWHTKKKKKKKKTEKKGSLFKHKNTDNIEEKNKR